MANTFFSGSNQSITQRLANETKAGTINLTRAAVVPAIPVPGEDVSSLRKTIMAMKTIADQREGNSGSVLDKHLTLRDLMNEGAVAVQIGSQIVSGTAYSGIDMGTGYQNPLPVLAIPPAPTLLTAQGAFKNVVLDWSLGAFANFAYTEVYRSGTNAIGTSVLIGTSSSNLYTDANVTVGSTYYYWVRAIAIGGQPGPYNAVGGTSAALLVIGNTDLGPLTVTAEKLSQGTYPNINLVANPGAEDGTVAWQQVIRAGTGGTFAVDTGVFSGGSQSFKLVGTGSDSSYAASTAFPVIPGETYSVKLKARGNAVSASGLWVRMCELSTKPASLSVNPTNGASITDLAANVAVTAAFVALEYQYTVPAGMYWVSINLLRLEGATMTTLYWDDVSVGRQITASFLAANSIAVGTAAIQNAAIVNAMIANLAVDNGKIANLDGGKINANTITAAQIAAATITGTQVAANTITAGNIDARGLSIKDSTGTTVFAAGTGLDFVTRFNGGVGTPSNNATADLAIINSSGMAINGNGVTKTGGAATTWDASFYSKDGYTGGAFVSWVITNAAGANRYMIGLNTDPATDDSYASIDYAWYVLGSGSGLNDIYESSVSAGHSDAVALGDVCAITYDGANVRYTINGAVKRTVAAAASLKLFADSSFFDIGASASNIRFGPYGHPSAVSPTNQITSGNVTTYIANVAIGAAQIGSLNADTITAGSIRGRNVQAGAHVTRGTFLVGVPSAGAATVTVDNTADFAASGSFIVVDSTNDRDVVAYTGKTSTTFTGCTTVGANAVLGSHTNGATVVPLLKCSVTDALTNDSRWYCNNGSGAIIEGAVVGDTTGLANFGTFGSTAAGTSKNGATGASDSAIGLGGYSISGNGVFAQSTSGDAISALSSTGNAAYLQGTVRMAIFFGRPSDRTEGRLAFIYTTGGGVDARVATAILMYADGTNWKKVFDNSIWTG